MPAAFDQPPAYQAHETPAADSSSPMVVPVWVGSLAPNAPNGCDVGCMVLTA